jgi:predicted acyltransferase
MSTASATPFSEPASKRLPSIDVLRGLTVAFMILVNNNGDDAHAYRQLNHSPWNGFTLTDLVFPTFLFIMGISMVLSFSARKARAVSKAQQILSILRRFTLLFVLGLVVNGFPYFHLSTLRIYGVLQRIAICYLLAALLQLLSDRVAPRIALFFAAVIAYWALLRFIPVPGYGFPSLHLPQLDPNINLVAWLDRQIFPHRLFEATRDPEGLLSDLPAFATTLLGMLTGSWLRAQRSLTTKLQGILVTGILLVAAGLLWADSFPINKRLWTSSYVLFAGGLSLLLLALFFYLLEIRESGATWKLPFLVFGTNAITAYVFSELLCTVVSIYPALGPGSLRQILYFHSLIHIVSPAFGSLVYSVAFVLVCFLPALALYRRKIFIKL